MISKIRAAGPMAALLSLASVLGTEACSDDITTVRPGSGARDAATTGDASGADASSPADATTDAGTAPWPDASPRDAGADSAADAAVDGSADGATDAMTDAAMTDAATDGAVLIPPDAALLRYGTAMWIGTDFVSSEVVAFGVPRSGVGAAVLGRTTLPSGDVVLASSGGRLFALQRDTGLVNVMNAAQPWLVERAIALTPDAGAYTDNPYDVAFVPAFAKAFVARYADNGVAVVNPLTGARATNVDLSPLMAPGDADGLVDAAQLLADGVSGKVFALLQRIDQFDFSGKCLTAKPVVAAIDPAAGALTGVGSLGGAVELQGANPQQMVLSASGRKLYVASVGCSATDASPVYTRRGIEEVDLATGAVRWVVREDGTARLGALLLWDGTAGYARTEYGWYTWSAATTTLTAAPLLATAPMFVADGSLVQLHKRLIADGGHTWAVEFVNPTLSLVQPLAGTPFSAVVPDPTYGIAGLFLPDGLMVGPPGGGDGARPSGHASSATPEALRRRAPSAR